MNLLDKGVQEEAVFSDTFPPPRPISSTFNLWSY